jgi:enamine deaminase RidA (YjgF/YER057c/UK114 family)
VLQVTIYVTDLADKPDFNRVWKAHFNEVNLPARATSSARYSCRCGSGNAH